MNIVIIIFLIIGTLTRGYISINEKKFIFNFFTLIALVLFLIKIILLTT